MFLARPYQSECNDDAWRCLQEYPGEHCVGGLPTGTGKSLLPAMFIKRAMQQYPFSRFAVCTHVKELIGQNEKAMRLVWPTAPVGVCSAGMKRWEPHAPIIYAGVQSIYKRAGEIGRLNGLFIDEAHLLSPDDNSMYQKLISDLLWLNPNMFVFGLSATLFRMGQGRLTDGDSIFSRVAYDRTSAGEFVKFIDDGYLSNLITPRMSNQVNVDDVRQMAYDYHQGDLQAVLNNESIVRAALEEGLDHARGRKSIMIFGAGIQNCNFINQIANEMGCPSVVVHSNTQEYPMDDETRDANIQIFKYGQARAITSYGILTTGFDHSQVDCIIDLRPTTSTVLHIQKYGRGTRPYYHPDFSFEQLRHKDIRFEAMRRGGKENCLICDFAGNTHRLGQINNPKIPSEKGEGGGEPPSKDCEAVLTDGRVCGAYNHAAARFCVLCGAEFIFRTKVKKQVNQVDVIQREDANFKILDIKQIIPQRHKGKYGKPDTVKVTYVASNFNAFPVWLSFEQDASPYAKHQSNEWWRQHFGDTTPTSTEEALALFPQCRSARQVKVTTPKNGYPQVLEYLF